MSYIRPLGPARIGRRAVSGLCAALLVLGLAAGSASGQPPPDKPPDPAALARLGVRVQPLSAYQMNARPPAALVVGYGHLPEPALRRGLAVLAHGLADL